MCDTIDGYVTLFANTGHYSSIEVKTRYTVMRALIIKIVFFRNNISKIIIIIKISIDYEYYSCLTFLSLVGNHKLLITFVIESV